MTGQTHPCDTRLALADALAEGRQSRDLMAAATEAAGRVVNRLQSALEGTVENRLNSPQEDLVARHRRQHRPGVHAKVEADPALRAFIIAHMHTMTFAEIVAASAAAFPPDRRPSTSGLHRGWHRHGKNLGDATHVTPPYTS
ncbi:MAG: hypothetical protein ACK4L4_08125 [Gemmobacter sp.]